MRYLLAAISMTAICGAVWAVPLDAGPVPDYQDWSRDSDSVFKQRELLNDQSVMQQKQEVEEDEHRALDAEGESEVREYQAGKGYPIK